MSEDPKGVLFYGYSWPEEQAFDTDLSTAVKELLKQRGHTDPWDLHYSGNYEVWTAWRDANPTEYDAWRTLVNATKAELGVDWSRGGSWEYPCPYLYVKGTEKSAEWGAAQPVLAEDLAVDAGWNAKLDGFLALQHIDPPAGENQPGWWLTSFYG